VRAVLDPNVLVSALISPTGAPSRLVTRWLAGDFELVVSDELLAELARALAYPKLRQRVTSEEAERYVELLDRAATHVIDPENAARRASDPGDDYLIGLAERASAVLVSGDAHVLALAPSLPIRTPADFLAELRD
jgi:uncharacterized protein